MQLKSVAPPKKPKHEPLEPAMPSEATQKLGFDFDVLNRHVTAKSPKYTKKPWRLGGSTAQQQSLSFTRKKFGGVGKLFWQFNSSSDLAKKAEPAANALSAEFGGTQLLAACQAIEKGKVKDTPVFHEHLKVLATAQKKWAAKQPLLRAAEELEAARGALDAQFHALELSRQDGLAEAAQRLEDMDEVRREAKRMKQAPGSPKQGRVPAKAKMLADRLVHKVTERSSAPVPAASGGSVLRSGESAMRGLEKRVKAAVLTRQPDADARAAKAKQQARMAEVTAANSKKTSLSVNQAALRTEVAGRAAARGVKPREYIEYLLLDTPVAAYLPKEVYAALRDMHAELSNEAHERFVADARAVLQPAKDRVAQMERVYKDALDAYNALPMPV